MITVDLSCNDAISTEIGPLQAMALNGWEKKSPLRSGTLQLFNRVILFLLLSLIIIVFYYSTILQYTIYNIQLFYNWQLQLYWLNCGRLVPPFHPRNRPGDNSKISSHLQPPSNPPTMSDSSQVAGKRKRARECFSFSLHSPLTLVPFPLAGIRVSMRFSSDSTIIKKSPTGLRMANNEPTFLGDIDIGA